MGKCIHDGGAIATFDLDAQVECAFVEDMTPSLTDVKELKPKKSAIPTILFTQSIGVKYIKEYIIVEPVDSRTLCIVSSLGCERRQS